MKRIGESMGTVMQDLGKLDERDYKQAPELPYGCKQCDGYGNIIGMNGAELCDCKKEYFQKIRTEDYGDQGTFENFSTPTARLKKLKDEVLNVTKKLDFQEQKTGTLLYGGAGCGKSHLMNAVAHWISKNTFYTVGLYDFQELMNKIKEGFGKDHAEDLLEEYLEKDIFILDDLSILKISEWTVDIVRYIINRRSKSNGALFITTNLDFVKGEVAEYFDPTIESRIYSRCVIIPCLNMEDWRMKKKTIRKI